MPPRIQKRHVLLNSLHIPVRKLRPLKWLAFLTTLLCLAQLATEVLLIQE